MKVALVYDRVNKFGGAERLLNSIHKIFPDAPLYTLVYDKAGAGWAKDFHVIPTFLNFIPWLRNKHEILAPIAPLAFESLNLSAFDVVISITSGDAKSIITGPGQLHICYCLTPTRYFWSGKNQYKNDIKMRILPRFIHNYLRTVDLLTSERPDEYIAISNEVKNRIKKYYNRDSSVVYPPIEDKFYSSANLSNRSRDYYLVVGRQVPYKRTDLVVEAFNKLNKKLLIAGEGSEVERLKAMAGDNITFLGRVDDDKLIRLYQNAKALISPQDEDFGLVPLEAQACGTPVIAFAKGGALETVIGDSTGVFFGRQTSSDLVRAIEKFESLAIKTEDCINNAKKFSETKFIAEMETQIVSLYSKHEKSMSFPAGPDVHTN